VHTISPRQREIRKRDAHILDVARQLLLADGYYGMTMDRIADMSECPKGTMYQRFACKEDLILALALGSVKRRLDMMRRGASFAGRPRQRMAGVGEGVVLYARLNPEDWHIIRISSGPIREKGSTERIGAIQRIENDTADLVRGILLDAVNNGDLVVDGGTKVEGIAYALCALAVGGYALVENDVAQNALGVASPLRALSEVYNRLADGYGWQPLYSELDWEETLAEIRRTVFPDEAQQLYGHGCWYGDAGKARPRARQYS